MEWTNIFLCLRLAGFTLSCAILNHQLHYSKSFCHLLKEMEFWFIILISISIAALLKVLINFAIPTTKPTNKLPPSPFTIPIITNILWLGKSFSDLEPILRSLYAKLGPVVTLHIGPRTAIFVSDRFLTHQALVQNGVVFADRPPPGAFDQILHCNQHNINSASYGPTWRILRRNISAEILHPSRVRSYSNARKWVLQILLDRLRSKSEPGEAVRVVDEFQYAMFCLLVLMCFGDKLSENQIKEIGSVQRNLLLRFTKFNVLNFWPTATKILLHKWWQEFHKLHQEQKDVLIPLIRARKMVKEESLSKDKGEYVVSYVDTLLDLELPEEKRKLDEGEMKALCSEFLNAGTDTTSTALQWIMANLVKYPQIQEKLFREIKGVVGDGEVFLINEDDLQRMPYLKAVILEGLRRHPPAHFVLPHAVTEDTMLDNYLIPKNGVINFAVAEMGWDPKVWEDPMSFKPERFMSSDDGGAGEAFDITGSKEIKMMPFGAGRRMCPGYGLGMLHLEYFVANLVWNFEWKAKDGDGVDLSEKLEFTVVMKNPLHAYISPRSKLA
ncbi:cytochrome P450 89A2-like [Tripterygium wilfordii]|uniref:cytochrome P450 89A2-like n=1 Tax=Tripterygium wilfordii TaxID=458696 RepID=UPI0018F8433C|nr:cytochrome P450 89A2-like [Tripterygium wilfordii]